MDLPRDDLLFVRNLLAERGDEMTPDELLATLNEVAEVDVVDEPGLASEIRRRLPPDPQNYDEEA